MPLAAAEAMAVEVEVMAVAASMVAVVDFMVAAASTAAADFMLAVAASTAAGFTPAARAAAVFTPFVPQQEPGRGLAAALPHAVLNSALPRMPHALRRA
ncbi:hypothetical protein [Bradyrhizobium tropiciagri]|uniref:hypothetical protein n=1 Tax=Bradyrhizobium tropiciagri TaxID=312253 RepID=UPI00201223E3|nr:hypothetical protein [Bradyrhizobium tropiciagri]